MDEMVLDIFRTDDFKATQMTEMVEDIDYVPYELDNLGIFEAEYLRTTTVTLYQEQGELHRIPTTERGTPEPTAERRGRVLRQFDGHRLAKRDVVRSHEVQDRLSPYLPQATRLLNANELVAERQAQLLDDLNYTKEFHRLGGLQGVTFDADGTTQLDDWFELFGVARPAAITFDFSKFKTVETQGELRALIDSDINTPMMRALKRRRRPTTRVHALVGDDFWSMLTASPAYERTMLTDSGRVMLNDTRLWRSVDLGGVVFHHYYGSDDKALQIADDEAVFFPVGARDVFKAYYMPGENFAEANQPGKEEYSVLSYDYRPNMNEWIEIYVKAYPVFACLCPQALLRGVLA